MRTRIVVLIGAALLLVTAGVAVAAESEPSEPDSTVEEAPGLPPFFAEGAELPPGIAKKDLLPYGLLKKVEPEALPPGIAKKGDGWVPPGQAKKGG